MRRLSLLIVAILSLLVSCHVFNDLYAVGFAYFLANTAVCFRTAHLWHAYCTKPTLNRVQYEEQQLDAILWSMILVIVFLLSSGLALFTVKVNAVSNIYVTSDLLTAVETNSIISLAEDHASRTGGWLTARHANYPTTDLAAYSIKEDMILFDSNKKIDFSKWLNETLLTNRVFPLMSKQYGINTQHMSIKDLFIVKYDAKSPGRQRRLETHQDSSKLSFNIALSEFGADFTGGGTMFDILDNVGAAVRIHKGSMLTHPSKLYHSGVEITEGLRYLLVGFVNVDAWQGDTFYRLFGEFSRCVYKYTDSKDGYVSDEKRCRSSFYVMWYTVDSVFKSTSFFLTVLKCIFVVLVTFLLAVIGCLLYIAACTHKGRK